MTKLHIVGVVGNDIITDSRVKKTAASAAAAGFRSTILCYTTGDRRVSAMGDVEVVRVPVPFHIRNRYGRVPAPARPFAGKETAGRHLGPRSSQLAKKRRLEAAIASGANHRGRLFGTKVFLWVRQKGFLARQRAHVTRDRIVRRAYLARTRLGLKSLHRFRNSVGHLLDYEIVFGPELEALQPDIIHAHDYHMIGVAVNAARLLRAGGCDTKVVYDAHELVEGLTYPQEVIDGWLDEEASYIHEVDAVIGVSPEQVARIKERYGLSQLPRVVLNAPLVGDIDPGGRTLRDEIPEGRILVYHGNVAAERGVFTMVEALAHLGDDIHLAIVAPADSPLSIELEERARDAGVEKRLHVLEFVPSGELPRFLESADLAVIPYQVTGNNDIALPNKLFESIQAGLPVLSSDMRALSRFIDQTGIGLVFEAGNPRDLAAKARAILDDLDTYRDRITPTVRENAGWDAQAETLHGVYRTLVSGHDDMPRVHVAPRDIHEPDRFDSWGPYRPRRLAVGPRNMAGQAHEMARAVKCHLGVDAASFVLDNGKFDFPADFRITKEAWFDPAWQTHQLRLMSSTFTHVLTESGTGIYGALNGGFVDEQIAQMRADRLSVGVLLHGSEIRDPRRHRHLPYSPYATDDDLIGDLEAATERLRRHLEGLDVPFFVTTPDLRDDIDAEWLPIVIDPRPWRALQAVGANDVPVVLHLPSNGLLKGSDHVDEVLLRLQQEGILEYLRPTGLLRPEDVAGVIEKSDIVVDGIVLGAYGVMSCQALAAGRRAIANTRDIGAIASSCPIVDASPSTLEAAIRQLISERDSWAEAIEAGQRFVDRYHDGSYSAKQLGSFLGV